MSASTFKQNERLTAGGASGRQTGAARVSKPAVWKRSTLKKIFCCSPEQTDT
ncbi:MAG: hypothetical protein H7Y30_15100 [Pyrinomonadaceae bacterium]|nr:hypothetical protein [Pyrinomonadaceae bacterium]